MPRIVLPNISGAKLRFYLKLAGLLVLIHLALVAAASRIIPFDALVKQVIAQLEQETGRKISVNGATTVALWPLPHVVVHTIYVANVADGYADSIVSIGELDLWVKLATLFSGHVAVGAMAASDVNAHLEILKDGSNNWSGPLQQLSAAVNGAGHPGTQPLFRNIKLTNSSVEVFDARKGTRRNLTRVNGSVAGDFNDYRTLTAAFSFSLDTVPVEIAVTRNAAHMDGTFKSGDTRVSLNGDFDGARPAIFHGNITAQSKNVLPLIFVAANQPFKAKELILPVTVASAAVWDGERVSLSDLHVALGDTEASGTLVIAGGSDAQSLDGDLTFGTLNMDHLGTIVDSLLQPATGDGTIAGGEHPRYSIAIPEKTARQP